MVKRIKNRRFYLYFTTLSLTLILAILCFFSLTDYKKNLTVYAYDGVVTLVTGEFSKEKVVDERTALSALDELNYIYGFDNVYNELKLDRLQESLEGHIFTFSQYYEDLYVFPREIKVSIDNNYEIDSISGNYLNDIKVDNDIILCELDAIDTALQIEGVNVVYESQLLIYSYEINLPIYAYEIRTDYEISSNIYIDAENAEIVDIIPLVSGASTQEYISDQTNHKDEQVEIVASKSILFDTYTLVDGYRNINIYDANGARGTSMQMIPNTTKIPSNNTGVFASEDSTYYEKVTVTAMNQMADIFDFYTDKDNIGLVTYGVNGTVKTDIFGEASQGSEKQVNVVVNLGADTVNNDDNAGCIPDYNMNASNTNYTTIVFYLGNKYNNMATSLDVMAHEYQHSVNSFLSGWLYKNSSGALDEAMADMFGMLVKAEIYDYEMSDSEFWDMGIELSKNNPKTPLRSAAYNVDGTQRYSVSKQYPFTNGYASSQNDYGGVHYNLTIITHAIYQAYKFAEENNIEVFTKSNLGKILYNAISKSTSSSSWTAFADLVCDIPDSLELNSIQKGQLRMSFEYGFDYVGIYNTGHDYDKRRIDFVIPEGFTGNAPESISAFAGEMFTIKESDIFKVGNNVIGWSEILNADYSSDFVYEIGVEYEMPDYNMLLYPVTEKAVFDNYELSVWEGEGTKLNPYKLNDVQDLATLGYYMNTGKEVQPIEDKHFELTSDIDLEDKEWVPIGTSSKILKTIYFNGNNHSIYNLKLTVYEESTGFFSNFSGELRNLHIKSGNIDVNAINSSALVGYLDKDSLIENCSNEIDIKNDANNTGSGFTGGIVGTISINSLNSGDTIIRNCLNKGNISANYAGGIFGRSISEDNGDESAIVASCINLGDIKGLYAGGISAISSNTSYLNCINSGKINKSKSSNAYCGGITALITYETEDVFSFIAGCKNSGIIDKGSILQGSYSGSIVGYVDETESYELLFENNTYKSSIDVRALGNSNLINNLSDTSKSGIIESQASLDFDYYNTEYYYNADNWAVFNGISNFDFAIYWDILESDIVLKNSKTYWIDAKSETFSEGDGTQNNPYQISSSEDLALFLYNISNLDPYSNKHYILTADIDLKGKLWSYQPDSLSFSGVFDGNEYIIKNLTSEQNGLFNNISNANIKNVRLQNCLISSSESVAGIANYSDSSVIENCIVSGNIISSDSACSIANIIDSTVVNCLNMATISAQNASGISNGENSTIEDCVNKGKVITHFEDGTVNLLANSAIDLVNCLENSDIEYTNLDTLYMLLNFDFSHCFAIYYDEGNILYIQKTARGEVEELYNPIRDGYEISWYLDEQFTEKITQLSITKNTSLYAKWSESEIEEDKDKDKFTFDCTCATINSSNSTPYFIGISLFIFISLTIIFIKRKNTQRG